MSDERDIDAIRLYFARTTLPPRDVNYFTDLARRIAGPAALPPPRRPQPGLAPRSDAKDRWELMVPHRERLLRIARRRAASFAEAEDVVSEAMLRCATFDGLDPARVEQFLTAVTMRLCTDTHRAAELRARNLRVLVALANPDEVPSPEESMIERRVLTDMLAALSPSQREIITMRASGLSVDEIARNRRMQIASVRSALARARKAMRTALETAL